jgi:acetolactate decarboxylase
MLHELMPSPNIFYAIRIEGVFSYLKARSVPKQESYRPLVDVTKEQPVFTFTDIEGTLAGFFTPWFMASISVPGLHLHFLSADLQHGGHLLECRPRQVRVGVQFISRLELALPLSLDYLTWDFRRDIHKDLHQGRIIHDIRRAEKRRPRVDELLARFEEVRRRDQLDETAAEMLRRVYV